MIPVAENPVIVPDHELEEEKKLGESEPPRIRCPTVRLVASQGRQMVLYLRQRVEHVRHWRRLSSSPLPVG